MLARDLRVVDDDVVVGRAADRSIWRRALREVELPDDGLVLFRRGARARGGWRGRRHRNAKRLCDLQEQAHLQGDRSENDHHAGIDRHRVVRCDARLPDRHAGGRSEIGQGEPIARQDRVLGSEARVLDDEVRLRGIVADDQLSGGRGELPACHQHQADGGMRDRNLSLPDRERRLQIEWHRGTGRDWLAGAGRGPLTIVHESERAVSLVNDARVVRRNAGSREHDVAVRSATNDDRLFSEPRDHRMQEVITPGGNVECH